MSEQSTPLEAQAAATPPVAQPSAVSQPIRPQAFTLALVIIALLGALIAIGLRNYMGRSGTSVESPEFVQLQAEANALRTQLNNDRMAMGLRPLESDSEPVEQIAERMKKDAATMVALANSFQGLLAEKDRELSAKSTEMLAVEQRCLALAVESKHLEEELDRARATVSVAGDLPVELAKTQAQRDGLAVELEKARSELAATSDGVSPDDVANLKRQLEETQHAKEFFESKVKEFEAVPNP